MIHGLFDNCIYTHEKKFHGGKSNSHVDLVSDTTGNLLVRKTTPDGKMNSATKNSQLEMSQIDREQFPGNPLVAIGVLCEECKAISCILTKFIQGESIDELLCEKNDLGIAHKYRMKIIEIMEKKGYFRQENKSKDKSMWIKWLEKRQKLFSEILDGTSKIINYIEPSELPEIESILQNAINILTNPNTEIPIGIFPRDITPGNALIGENEEPILIDQQVFTGDPVIVAIKLTFGWRLLSNTFTDKGTSWDDLQKHLSIKDKIKLSDQEMLDAISSQFPNDPDFLNRYHAAMIIRHIRGIEFVASENIEDEKLIKALTKEIISYIKDSAEYIK